MKTRKGPGGRLVEPSRFRTAAALGAIETRNHYRQRVLCSGEDEQTQEIVRDLVGRGILLDRRESGA